MKQTTLHETLERAKALLHRGNLREARRLLSALISAKPERRSWSRIAYLAREAYAPELAIGLLHRSMGAESKHRASDDERAEYGMALAQLGVAVEAIAILSKVDLKRFPYVFGALSLAQFRMWDWARALPAIEGYLSLDELTDSQRWLGELRLGTALLHGKAEYAKSQAVLKKLRAETRHSHIGLFHEASLMLAQSLYFQNRFSESARIIDEIEDFIRLSPEKGVTLALQLLRSEILIQTEASPRRGLALLRRVQSGFAAQGRWAQVRSCAYGEAQSLRDEKKYARLYFGTPFPGARERFLRDLGWAADQMPEFFDLCLGEESRKMPLLELSEIGGNLKPGQLPQRVILALASDFYQPPTISELHGRIYPGERYDHVHSAGRAREALLLTRRWLSRNRVPLEIAEQGRVYRLASPSGVRLRITRELAEAVSAPAEVKRALALMQRIRARFGHFPFSREELAAEIGVSKPMAILYLSDLVRERRLIRIGTGPSTRYQV